MRHIFLGFLAAAIIYWFDVQENVWRDKKDKKGAKDKETKEKRQLTDSEKNEKQKKEEEDRHRIQTIIKGIAFLAIIIALIIEAIKN